MNEQIIDAHIHLDMYKKGELQQILQQVESTKLATMVAVSNHFASCQVNYDLAKQSEVVKPAFGFHPEQDLPKETELRELIQFIEMHHKQAVAIGEVGLPYYKRQNKPNLDLNPYIELLEVFIQLAKRLDLPISLHAVYEDADIVCDLLEKHSIQKAHFHWFKGSKRTVERMVANGYLISITPDIYYEQEIQNLVYMYPLTHLMMETDGPWSFEGPFAGKMTHPKMIHQTVREIAHLKKQPLKDIYQQIYTTTSQFFSL
ncbi:MULTISPECIES: TatD family hydrolase [Clostridia]|uniref:TatD family hydrolase n=1 Tax=Clostridia TaxID=186801 RepID=UPI000EA2F46A|nr:MULTISPECIES: TatD family hydrolase [Clostridia]NBJ69670.1 TatD family deoxyribonuclease [Roseburia sp. 1XD42-34]RKI78278.1 TatD family deoxyribonuclease [Clostridium sp. 1xD42-85]